MTEKTIAIATTIAASRRRFPVAVSLTRDGAARRTGGRRTGARRGAGALRTGWWVRPLPPPARLVPVRAAELRAGAGRVGRAPAVRGARGAAAGRAGGRRGG